MSHNSRLPPVLPSSPLCATAYENWLDQQGAPAVSEKKRRHKSEEKDVDAAPWVAPHKDPVLPEWQSALGSLPAKKKQATWEKRVRKSLKKSVVPDRPDFSVPKKATVPDWVSEAGEPPKKNYVCHPHSQRATPPPTTPPHTGEAPAEVLGPVRARGRLQGRGRGCGCVQREAEGAEAETAACGDGGGRGR